MPNDTVTLALDGDVPLEEFARTMGRFAELVNALSEEVGSPGLDWVVDDLQVSSAVATVRSPSDLQAARKSSTPIQRLDRLSKTIRQSTYLGAFVGP